VIIARALPGLFSYEDFARMEFRELIFWSGEARQVLLLKRIEAYVAARMGMATESSFNNAIEQLLAEWKAREEGLIV
jgi:hypothetical protein